MNRNDITDHVRHIMDRITAAYTAVERLRNSITDAVQRDPSKAVVYSDIQHDLSLPKLWSDLAGLYDIIERASDNLLPDHLERLTGKPAYNTTYVMPPIPMRDHDWCACIDGQEEDGPYGWGATEAEAIADLKEKLEDAA